MLILHLIGFETHSLPPCTFTEIKYNLMAAYRESRVKTQSTAVSSTESRKVPGLRLGYGMDGRGYGISFMAETRDSSVLHSVLTDSGSHPASNPMSMGALSPGGKAAVRGPL
jgi:hypothetical protein